MVNFQRKNTVIYKPCRLCAKVVRKMYTTYVKPALLKFPILLRTGWIGFTFFTDLLPATVTRHGCKILKIQC